ERGPIHAAATWPWPAAAIGRDRPAIAHRRAGVRHTRRRCVEARAVLLDNARNRPRPERSKAVRRSAPSAQREYFSVTPRNLSSCFFDDTRTPAHVKPVSRKWNTLKTMWWLMVGLALSAPSPAQPAAPNTARSG